VPVDYVTNIFIQKKDTDTSTIELLSGIVKGALWQYLRHIAISIR